MTAFVNNLRQGGSIYSAVAEEVSKPKEKEKNYMPFLEIDRLALLLQNHLMLNSTTDTDTNYVCLR